MLNAFGFLIHQFQSAYRRAYKDVDEETLELWRIFAAYYPKVTDKYRCSTWLKEMTPSNLAAELLTCRYVAGEGAERTKRGYDTLEELAFARTNDSIVAKALMDAQMVKSSDAAAQKVGKQGSQNEFKGFFAARGAYTLTNNVACRFRPGFAAALERDGLDDDIEGLWQGIDALLDAAPERVDTLSAQRDAMASLVLASLQGARDYKPVIDQLAGRPQRGTPVYAQADLAGATEAARQLADSVAQLQRIERLGAGAREGEDYTIVPGEVFVLESQRAACIGRDHLALARSRCQPIPVEGTESVSREHARVLYEGGSWWIADLSTNGTLVTREEAGQTKSYFVNRDTFELRDGDLLCLAPFAYRSRQHDEWLPGDVAGILYDSEVEDEADLEKIVCNCLDGRSRHFRFN